MNIQDLISTIINYVKNMDKKDLVIFTLFALLFYRTRNVEGNENVAIDDSTLNSSHLAAIRNLGNLAKSLQDGNNIVLPGDVKINGKLSVGPEENVIIDHDRSGGRINLMNGGYDNSENDDKTRYQIKAYRGLIYTDAKLLVNKDLITNADLTVNNNLTVNGLVNNDLTVNNNLTVKGDSFEFGNISSARDNQPLIKFGKNGTGGKIEIKYNNNGGYHGSIRGTSDGFDFTPYVVFRGNKGGNSILSMNSIYSKKGFAAEGEATIANKTIGPYIRYDDSESDESDAWDEY